MRLIDVDTLRLREFAGVDSAPDYAILSHTWGDGEVSYQDFQNLETAQAKEGFQKIRLTCLQAKADGLQWAWVDTCCIDKSSSHELSEAINSMFRWYMNAVVCYTYLVDVPGDCPPLDLSNGVHPRQLKWIEAFEESRWFLRGWTLQELIAPRQLFFFNNSWGCIGSRSDLVEKVSSITNIQTDVLNQSRPLADLSVARRLSWAATRETTRIEDQAYSLLGIMDVNMPLLYGEGKGAFLRLQEEIIKKSTDQSIFAWNSPPGFIEPKELLLAPSPRCFRNGNRIRRRRYTASESSFHISNKGLEITLPVLRRRLTEDPMQPHVTLGILDCKYEGSNEVLALVMNQHPFSINSGTLALETYVSGYEQNLATGPRYSRLLSIHPREIEEATPKLVTITRDLQSLNYIQAFNTNKATWFPLRFTGENSTRLPRLRDVFPDQCWSDSTKTMKLRVPRIPYGGIVVDTMDNLSVLICFGMGFVPANNSKPDRRLYGIEVIDPNCPIQPHLDRLVRHTKYTSNPETLSLRVSKGESVVARLWQGALTVCIESVRETSEHMIMTPVGSPVASVPTSPQLYTRRLSGTQGSASGSMRRDSLLQDDRSEQSANSQDGIAPRATRLKVCEHCRTVKEREWATLKQEDQEKQRKIEEEGVAKRRRERTQQVYTRAKQASVGLSVGGVLWDLAEAAEFLV